MTHDAPPARRRLLFTAFCMLAASPAAAAEAEGVRFQSTLDTGVAQVSEDTYAALLIHQRISCKNADIVLAGPFRFRFVDRAPANGKGLRSEDWDTPSDFGRIVPRLALSHTFEEVALAAQFGEINDYTLGFGNTFSHFFNNTEINHYRTGADLSVDWRGNQGAVLIDNLFSPALFGVRLQLAPLSWFREEANWRWVRVALSLSGDLSAPHVRYQDATRAILIPGGEISSRVLDRAPVRLDLYATLSVMDGDPGAHAGFDVRWQIGQKEGVVLMVQGEYRYVGSDYHPALFNPLYEKTRYNFAPVSQGPAITLADHLTHEPDLPSRHGFMLECAFAYGDAIAVELRYDREGSGRKHWVLAGVRISPFSGYHIRIFYAADDPRGDTGIFSYNALMAAAVRGRIYGPVDIFAHFMRRFERENHTIAHVNELIGGIGVAVSY